MTTVARVVTPIKIFLSNLLSVVTAIPAAQSIPNKLIIRED
jgi:hypothetical protein